MKTARVLLIIPLLLTAQMFAAAQDQTRRPQLDPATRQKQVDAMRAGGLRAAAQVTGEFRGIEPAYTERDARTLQELVDLAELIVVGTIKTNRMWLTADGNKITTDYVIELERTLKGAAPGGAAVTVSMPFGRVTFPEGGTADIRIPSFTPPGPGQKFVLFLRRSAYQATPEQRAAARGPLYTPYPKTLGIFQLSPERGVLPKYPDPRHPIRTTYTNVSEGTFVTEIQTAVEASKAGR